MSANRVDLLLVLLYIYISSLKIIATLWQLVFVYWFMVYIFLGHMINSTPIVIKNQFICSFHKLLVRKHPETQIKCFKKYKWKEPESKKNSWVAKLLLMYMRYWDCNPSSLIFLTFIFKKIYLLTKNKSIVSSQLILGS